MVLPADGLAAAACVAVAGGSFAADIVGAGLVRNAATGDSSSRDPGAVGGTAAAVKEFETSRAWASTPVRRAGAAGVICAEATRCGAGDAAIGSAQIVGAEDCDTTGDALRVIDIFGVVALAAIGTGAATEGVAGGAGIDVVCVDALAVVAIDIDGVTLASTGTMEVELGNSAARAGAGSVRIAEVGSISSLDGTGAGGGAVIELDTVRPCDGAYSTFVASGIDAFIGAGESMLSGVAPMDGDASFTMLDDGVTIEVGAGDTFDTAAVVVIVGILAGRRGRAAVETRAGGGAEDASIGMDVACDGTASGGG